MRVPLRYSGIAVVVLALSLALAPSAAAQLPNICLGDTGAAGVEKAPGELLRFGITPAGEAGALGPPVPAVPGSTAQDLAALSALRPAGGPFVIRLNRFFWSRGEEGIQHFERLARTFTDAGYLVELQLRYHPSPEQEGRIDLWTAFVREVVRRFGPNRRVVALQVTNEVNLTFSPDSSDGAYRGARDALIEGVKAADHETRVRGYEHLGVGFNWVYRLDPFTEASFWGYLRDHGGSAFTAAVDWVGLDAYPGTFFPPIELLPGGFRDGMVNAMSVLRECFLPIAGIGAGTPIHVEENGYPTGLLRSEAQQVEAMREMVGAVHDFRGTYNVSDYRWFDLRDHASTSLNFQHQYGLLKDDYSPKPGFRAYADLAGSLSRTNPVSGPGSASQALSRARKTPRCRKKRRRKARRRCLRQQRRKRKVVRGAGPG